MRAVDVVVADILLLVAAAVGIGVASSMLGIGGGSLIVPLLILSFNLTSHQAIGTSLFVIIFAALSSTLAYSMQRRVDFKSGLLLGVGTIPGGAFGAYLTRFVGGDWLKAVFGVFLILISLRFLSSLRGSGGEGHREVRYGWKRRIVDLKGEVFEYDLDVLAGVGGSFIAGVVSGFLGIGGGVVMVPVLRFLAGMPMHLAVSASLLVICLTSTAGAGVHILLGHVVFEYGVLLAGGVVLGAQVGARLARRTRPRGLQLLFGVAMMLIGLRMALPLLL